LVAPLDECANQRQRWIRVTVKRQTKKESLRHESQGAAAIPFNRLSVPSEPRATRKHEKTPDDFFFVVSWFRDFVRFGVCEMRSTVHPRWTPSETSSPRQRCRPGPS